MLGITFPRVNQGDRPKAEDENALRAQVEALSNIQGPGLRSFGNHYRRGSDGSNSSRGDLIDFEILEWFPNADPDDPICDCVLAVVTAVQCGSSVQVGDEVLICDPSLCWFNMPTELLIGSTGFATLMDRSGLLDSLSCPALLETYSIDDCIWVVRSICCRESAAYV